MEDGIRWYVVHTHARGEQIACENLERQGFTTIMPRYRKRRRHARKTDWVKAPLFPRYLFVAIDMAKARWRAIASTVGVSHLICEGDRPLAVPERVVEELRSRMRRDGIVDIAEAPPFAPGEVVKMTGGAFSDHTALFRKMTDDERVVLLFDLLGRQVEVRLPLNQVAAYP